MNPRQKITTFLWFDANAEEAVNWYVSIFGDSKVREVTRCGDAGPGPKGSVLVISFQLEGQEFAAMNGGPSVRFNQAISLMVSCGTQREIDDVYRKLLADGGEESACGWVQDRYGLSWQVTPPQLLEWIRDPDPAKSARVMKSMMTMRKLDLAQLEQAHRGT